MLVRRPAAFFQANRHILPHLVQRTLAWVERGPLVDLFAGVGMFGVCAAARGVEDVWCVEGDPVSGEDLLRNVEEPAARVRAATQPVESFVGDRSSSRLRGATVLVDPPRTGLPSQVTDAITAARPPRLIYVSCDPPTFARDLRRLHEAGFVLRHLEAFDMFPQTAHLETLAVFDRASTPDS
jgi:23S rRNA (uracil1939-C5)-methyltransferase